MSGEKGERPACFGDLDRVFPMGDEGLRVTPESCMICCRYKTECLRTAMQTGQKGIAAQEEHVDRAYDSGMIGFFTRWSRKKQLARKKGEER